MIDRRTFIKNTALAAGGVVLLSAGGNLLAADKAKKPKLKEIDTSKMKLEVTKNGVLLIPFEMNSLISLKDMQTRKPKRFPIKAIKKTAAVSHFNVYKNKKGELVIEVFYYAFKKNYAPEIESQLLNDEKVIIHRKKIKREHPGPWMSRGWLYSVSHKFNFGEIKIGDIKYIGIGAK